MDGIQKTPWKTWLQRVRDDGYCVNHLPLKSEHSSTFDEESAISFFNSVEGTKYGFSNIFFVWIDSLKNNYPCLPPDYSSNCLMWETFETFALLMDRAVPFLTNVFVNQGLNNRLGTDFDRFADLVYEGFLQGHESIELFKLPELDDYRYTTTRYDEVVDGAVQNVCSAFACNILKHGGILDGIEANCAEHSGLYFFPRFFSFFFVNHENNGLLITFIINNNHHFIVFVFCRL